VTEEGKRKPVWRVAPELLYGQVRKVRAGHRLKRLYTKMVWGERAMMEERLQAAGLTGWIQTAFVERVYLTLRHLVSALVRRTWALANNTHSLRWRVALAAGYYNFGRTHTGHGLGRDGSCVEHPGVHHPPGVLRT
jgi:hypothetical protein